VSSFRTTIPDFRVSSSASLKPLWIPAEEMEVIEPPGLPGEGSVIVQKGPERMLARIRKAMEEKDEGFTLIELLVVIIIIGILAAIAIPVYLNQRNKGYDAAAKNDAKSLGTMQEAYLTDNDEYGTYPDAVAPLPAITDFKATDGVLTTAVPDSKDGFCIISVSQSGKYFVYDSNAGGLQSDSFDAFADIVAPTGGTCADVTMVDPAPAPAGG
jgi:type IV pilus assembly protein PilA